MGIELARLGIVLWKLTTTLRQQAQRNQNKNVFNDYRLPFSIFLRLDRLPVK